MNPCMPKHQTPVPEWHAPWNTNISLQPSAATLVSKIIGADISIMEDTVRSTLRSKLKAVKSARIVNGPTPKDGKVDLLDVICRRSSDHLSK